MLLTLFWICLALAFLTAIVRILAGKSFSRKGEGNQPFNRQDLEGATTRDMILDAYEGISDKAKSDLGLQLVLGYLFMVCLYYAIAALCYMGSRHHPVKNIALTGLILAVAQVFAHLADTIENYYLYQYRTNPQFKGPFLLYQIMVRLKGGIALTGGTFAILLVIYNRLAYGHFLFF